MPPRPRFRAPVAAIALLVTLAAFPLPVGAVDPPAPPRAGAPAPPAAKPGAADDDPDTELARRLFKEGSALYIAGNYQKALELFEKARQAKPLAAFDFN